MWPFKRRRKQLHSIAATLDGLLISSLERQGVSMGEIFRHRLVLENFIAGRIEVDPDERLVAIQKWALLIAREHGARSAREALEIIKSPPISTDEWERSSNTWEFLWASLPDFPHGDEI